MIFKTVNIFKYNLFLVAQWQGVRLRFHSEAYDWSQRKIPGSIPGKEVFNFVFVPSLQLQFCQTAALASTFHNLNYNNCLILFNHSVQG